MKPFSFIVITYNRPHDLLSLVRNIIMLDKADELLEEVIIVNNASTSDYREAKQFMDAHSSFPFRYIEHEENLGVARGRNFAAAQSRSPYLIMLDDDAEMGNRDCLINLSEVFSKPPGEREIAIISFRVEYFENRQLQINTFPHKLFRKYSSLHSFETYYFAGGAHAIRKDVFEQVGGYPEDFFYGMEEYDLSYRVIEAGYAIMYSDRILMLHKESPHGRKTIKEKMAMLWVNKSKVAWRYLPSVFFYSTAILWSLEYLYKTGIDIKGFFHTWKKILHIPDNETRRPLGAKALEYLQKTHARLWY